MGSGFNSFDQSPLGAFIQSTLGVRGFTAAAAGVASGDVYLISADIRTGVSNVTLFLFSTDNGLPNALGVDGDGSPTYIPTTLGNISGGNISVPTVEEVLFPTGQGIKRRAFDYDGTYALIPFDANVGNDGFDVYDLSGASPSRIWRYAQAEAAEWKVGPVISNGLVCWGEYDTTGVQTPQKQLLLKRYAVDTGVDQGDILVAGVESPETLEWIAFTETHDRTGLIWEYTETQSAESPDPVVSKLQRVSTDGVAVVSFADLNDDTYAPDGMRVSSDGTLYVYNAGNESIKAYQVSDLAAVPAKDFDLNPTGESPTPTTYLPSGDSYWTVINDLLYFSKGGAGGTEYVDVLDRAGVLVASMDSNLNFGNAILWADLNPSGESPAPTFGTLKRPVPEFPTLNNDVISTATTAGESPETNIYTRVANPDNGFTGADDIPVTSIDTAPSGTFLGASGVEWRFNVVDLPVIAAKSDDNGSVGVPYNAVLSSTPSEVHGDTHLFELSAVNRQGSDSASWTSTVNTPVTWTLPTAPAGATILGLGASAFVSWSSPTAGAHSFTAQAETHIGIDTESWTLTVT